MFDLEVGEDLEEERDDGVRRAIACHPAEGACVVSVDVDVGEVARGARNERGDKREGDNSGEKFPYVDVGLR